MKYSFVFFKIISQYSDKFKDIKDLEDLDLVISRTLYLSNQNNNNKIDMQYNNDSFSHVNFLKIFNKIYEKLKYQYFIIQNLNISFVILEYCNLKLVVRRWMN